MTRSKTRCGNCGNRCGVYANGSRTHRVVEIRCAKFEQEGGPTRRWNRDTFSCPLWVEAPEPRTTAGSLRNRL